CQGRKGSRRTTTPHDRRAATRASSQGAQLVQRGPQARLTWRLPARCFGEKVPPRRQRMDLAVRFPKRQSLHRPAQRRHKAPPPSRERPAKGREVGCDGGGHTKEGKLPRVAAFVRHASAGKWL